MLKSLLLALVFGVFALAGSAEAACVITGDDRPHMISPNPPRNGESFYTYGISGCPAGTKIRVVSGSYVKKCFVAIEILSAPGNLVSIRIYDDGTAISVANGCQVSYDGTVLPAGTSKLKFELTNASNQPLSPPVQMEIRAEGVCIGP